jgi:hypothetical protein
MSAFEDFHPHHGSPALIGLFMVLSIFGGYFNSLFESLSAPLLFFLVVVLIGVKFG